jgi:RNA polymerase sigma-70 factor, ECF subfamily
MSAASRGGVWAQERKTSHQSGSRSEPGDAVSAVGATRASLAGAVSRRPTGGGRPVSRAASLGCPSEPAATAEARSVPLTEPRDFAEFYSATFHSLTVQLYAHTGDLSEAQDVVQEAFCRALPRWSRLRSYDDPAAWVRKVAWNLATNRWRRTRRMVALTLGHRGEPDEREKNEEPASLDRIDLVRALAKLPVRQRQAVVLHYLADAPIAEIAQLTGASQGTVKSWLHRARTSLAVHLTEPSTALGPGAHDA